MRRGYFFPFALSESRRLLRKQAFMVVVLLLPKIFAVWSKKKTGWLLLHGNKELSVAGGGQREREGGGECYAQRFAIW